LASSALGMVISRIPSLNLTQYSIPGSSISQFCSNILLLVLVVQPRILVLWVVLLAAFAALVILVYLSSVLLRHLIS
jgi:hypothetical protein